MFTNDLVGSMVVEALEVSARVVGALGVSAMVAGALEVSARVVEAVEVSVVVGSGMRSLKRMGGKATKCLDIR